MKNLFVLKGVSDFAPGAFENTAVENGSIQLGQRGSDYLPRGSYTSPAFRLEPFRRLLAGWNADTPPGTTVEMQARVAAGGRWSRWLSFGIWSPFVYRASCPAQEDDFVTLEGDTLLVHQQGIVCDTAQLRILLHSEAPAATPLVRLLAVTVQPHKAAEEQPVYAGRVLHLPAYSCLVRDPAIGGHIASATTLTMLMNRWGEDALPEETARAMYDTESGRFGNLAFLSAAAGMYSYECYPYYCGLDAVRREVQHGAALAVQLAYRATLNREEQEEGAACDLDTAPGAPTEERDSRPVWEEATADSYGHLAAVCGFVQRGGNEYAVVHDPLSPSDRTVRREVPMGLFRRMYTGLAFFLHKGPKGAGRAKPERKLTGIEVGADGEVQLSVRGELLQPGENIPVKSSRATIAYTLDDGVAYASAAQKQFYYILPGEDGRIRLDPAGVAGRKLTFYLIGSRGTTWVAEKTLPAAPPPEAPPAQADGKEPEKTEKTRKEPTA